MGLVLIPPRKKIRVWWDMLESVNNCFIFKWIISASFCIYFATFHLLCNKSSSKTFAEISKVLRKVFCLHKTSVGTITWAVVVAQLVERSLPIPEVCSSNLVIGKHLYLYWTFVYCQLCIEKTKIKKKRPGMAHFFKKAITYSLLFRGTHAINIWSKLWCRVCYIWLKDIKIGEICTLFTSIWT